MCYGFRASGQVHISAGVSISLVGTLTCVAVEEIKSVVGDVSRRMLRLHQMFGAWSSRKCYRGEVAGDCGEGADPAAAEAKPLPVRLSADGIEEGWMLCRYRLRN